MVAQKCLEGEYYVTLSLMPYMISKIRDDLSAIVYDEDEDPTIVSLARRMLQEHNTHWGSGIPGTVWLEAGTIGPRNRPKGYPKAALFAAALDPRTKNLAGIPEPDRKHIWDHILIMMIEVAAGGDPAPADPVPPGNQVPVDPVPPGDHVPAGPVPAATLSYSQKRRKRESALFDGIGGVRDQNQPVIRSRMAVEFALYKSEAHIPVFVDGVVQKNCMEWWKCKHTSYPTVWKLARKYLCIPATSAPSERVFSTAGLTVVKNRNRLSGDMCDAQVFLHDYYPFIRLREERKRAKLP